MSVIQKLLSIRPTISGIPKFSTKTKTVKAVLIDLGGTLHIEDTPIPNAIKALQKLRETDVVIKFVTNTTKESRQTLYQRLKRIGFQLEDHELHSCITAAAQYICKNKLNPFYLLTDDARKDFAPTDAARPLDSVVVGSAPPMFHFQNMDLAFNLLIANRAHRLVAIHCSKYFSKKSGLSIGPGAFVKALEYAANTKAVLIGKPNPRFFIEAIPKGLKPAECLMIGDDAHDDIMGAMSVGMQAILVKTGKYLPHIIADPPPTAIVSDFNAAVKWIFKNITKNCN